MSYLLVLMLAVVGLFATVTYNILVRLRRHVRRTFADIEVQLRRRHDLVPDLVAAVKDYATHDREVLEDVVAARQAAVAVEEDGGQVAAEEHLSLALDQMFALGEAYPELEADANFHHLQHQLAQVEDELATARRVYNLAVADYNAAISAFPAMLFARALGFSHSEFFDLPATDRGHLERIPRATF